jgi:hypothetical protein
MRLTLVGGVAMAARLYMGCGLAHELGSSLNLPDGLWGSAIGWDLLVPLLTCNYAIPDLQETSGTMSQRFVGMCYT